MNSKIKIIELVKKLGFNERAVYDKYSATFKKNNNTSYEIFIGENIGNFSKTTYVGGVFLNTDFICSSTRDFDYIYQSLLIEFKPDIRKNKIKNLLN